MTGKLFEQSWAFFEVSIGQYAIQALFVNNITTLLSLDLPKEYFVNEINRMHDATSQIILNKVTEIYDSY